ncbi:hypothetical protein [Kangiella koreensis]|uniref:hypothetical protein n=1 Tax=Kangiella koreensis TaxID=261964 RepID=UPI001180CF4B|nr:hypothetical protein [Kangiella koreensis]
MHPYLGEACQEVGISTVSVSLSKIEIKPKLENERKELELSITALRQKFKELLESERMMMDEIKSADIIFNFSKSIWPDSCYIEVVTQEDKRIEVAVDSLGNPAEILKAER